MKKQTNISVLKELVNNNVMERVELYTSGVQAYDIAEGEEYNVIVAYEKQGGRYYFIDRDGRRFLASRYYRAEFVAGEMLEVIANDRAAAQNAADQVEKHGSVLMRANLLPLFFEECDRRNISVTSTATGFDNFGRMFTKYDLVKDEPTQQDDDNNNDTQSNESNEGNEGKQTAAEPSALAQKVAKVAESVKTYTTQGARRVALLLSLLFVLVLSFGVVLGCLSLMLEFFDALRITGAARVVLAFLVVLGPAMELGINIESNALAVVARLFPGSFHCRMPFGCFSFWGRMLRA